VRLSLGCGRDALAGGAFSAPMGYDALDYEAQVLRDQVESMASYALLKRQLLRRTQRAGAALAAYLLLTVSGEVTPPPRRPCLLAHTHTASEE